MFKMNQKGIFENSIEVEWNEQPQVVYIFKLSNYLFAYKLLNLVLLHDIAEAGRRSLTMHIVFIIS